MTTAKENLITWEKEVRNTLPRLLNYMECLLEDVDGGNDEDRENSRYQGAHECLEKVRAGIAWQSVDILNLLYESPGGENHFLEIVKARTGIGFKWSEEYQTYYAEEVREVR